MSAWNRRPASALKLPAFQRGKRKDILFFTQELSTLLNAGVPLDRALSITAELTEHANFRTLVLDIVRLIKGGKSLADSLAAHPAYFSDLYVNMVRAGEASGSLSQIFDRLAEFERTRDDLRSYIVSSLIYPGLLTIVGISSIIVLLEFVVPRFAQIFSDPRMTIPTPTLMLLATSRYLQMYGLPAAIVLAAAIVSLHHLYPHRRRRDVVGHVPSARAGARRRAAQGRDRAFRARHGDLVAASVPLVQSIGISRGILNNRRIAASLERVITGVKRGEGIAGPLAKAGEFPPLAAHLLSVGEETGHLDAMFVRMADIYETETRSAIRRFTSLFEPLIILVMGLLIGTLILSLMLAITSINDIAG